ncbi:TPR end-of-group domain-containing protein [Algibacillus agarilyticus]|uniref:TPR end-of-group domain-containing protein n=1 Tax=Algibacillus agarilyticus TaxID=2234133 RepID=UPI000DCFC402|nr:CDC27 family protein [Algibacillus agarilyticus]
MPRVLKIVVLLSGLFSCFFIVHAADLSAADKAELIEQVAQQQNNHVKLTDKNLQDNIDELDKALYSPFIERFVLDELKQQRIDLANTKHELMQQILDREHQSVDRGVAYATDTITYFFYLIAAATSVLVVVGWSSIRDIKERVHTQADEEISKLIDEYENRLAKMETLLNQKVKHIEENREEIELTQEIQSLWLRAQQEISPSTKISIYDDLLKLRPQDCEALTYKADAVLELSEPQWAVNLCHQALKLDPQNSHAFYQLACAYTAMENFEDALRFLAEALNRRESYFEEVREDPALQPLVNHSSFAELTKRMGKHF